MKNNMVRRLRRIPIVRRATPPGTAPGTLTVDPQARAPRILAMGYGPAGHLEFGIPSADVIGDHRSDYPVLWVNVDGLGDHETLQQIGDEFSLHRLTLEDVVSIPQRPKVEEHGSYLVIMLRLLHDVRVNDAEQISIVLGDDFVVTFQEREGDPFDEVRRRIRSAKGRLTHAGADYLAYALLDAIIDTYFPLVEACGERLDGLEEEMLAESDSEFGPRIHGIKRELLLIRRALLPMREMLHVLIRTESAFIGDETKVYLRDCEDHVIQLLDLVETYRELSSGLLDVHLASMSNRMNEVMKVLTVFAATFIPLSFIAGVYGMNFRQDSPWNMPELGWKYGYPAVVGVMLAVAAGLLLYFRHLGWIGRSGRRSGSEREG
jgi:magnesium transporter